MAQEIEYYLRRWRRFMPRSRTFRGPMPVVPLINVGFLIILFNMLGSAFVLKPGVRVELPVQDFIGGSRSGSMVVILTQEGRVFFNDEWMPMNKLESEFRQAARSRSNLSLVIEADAKVPYGAIMQVMNMATAARIPQVDLATRPPAGEQPQHENTGKQD